MAMREIPMSAHERAVQRMMTREQYALDRASERERNDGRYVRWAVLGWFAGALAVTAGAVANLVAVVQVPNAVIHAYPIIGPNIAIGAIVITGLAGACWFKAAQVVGE